MKLGQSEVPNLDYRVSTLFSSTEYGYISHLSNKTSPPRSLRYIFAGFVCRVTPSSTGFDFIGKMGGCNPMPRDGR